MSNILGKATAFLISFVVFFLFLSFVEWSVFIYEWSAISRFILVAIPIVVIFTPKDKFSKIP